jgi:hypothetical protein
MKGGAMQKETPYYMLQQWFIGCGKGINRFKLTLCAKASTRERMAYKLYDPMCGWAPVHMKESAAEMRNDIQHMFDWADIKDETGMVL